VNPALTPAVVGPQGAPEGAASGNTAAPAIQSVAVPGVSSSAEVQATAEGPVRDEEGLHCSGGGVSEVLGISMDISGSTCTGTGEQGGRLVVVCRHVGKILLAPLIGVICTSGTIEQDQHPVLPGLCPL
jgi:hypothetical protein